MWYAKADQVYMIHNTEWTQPANGLQDRLDYEFMAHSNICQNFSSNSPKGLQNLEYYRQCYPGATSASSTGLTK